MIPVMAGMMIEAMPRVEDTSDLLSAEMQGAEQIPADRDQPGSPHEELEEVENGQSQLDAHKNRFEVES